MPGLLLPLRCLLCQADLELLELEGPQLAKHPDSALCEVRICDLNGVCVDDRYELEGGILYDLQPPPEPAPEAILDFRLHAETVEQALNRLFESYKLPRLGGASGIRGWSSYSTFQRCPYLWKRTYLDSKWSGEGFAVMVGEPINLAIGSLVHVILAIYYQKLIDPTYPITPEIVYDFLQNADVSQEAVEEAWRVTAAYFMFYAHDYFRPLAVEYLIADPRAGESCRLDLIASIDEPTGALGPGTYVIEHKTAKAFYQDVIEGWANDGEVIGQVMLYERMKLEKRFGPLKGVIVNILGKQKIPNFHRTIVAPARWQIRQHAADLKIWDAYRQQCTATGVFPRARASCITRFGKCSQWDHCSAPEEPKEPK